MIFLSKSPFKQANDNHYDHFSIGPSRILDSPSINSYLVKRCSWIRYSFCHTCIRSSSHSIFNSILSWRMVHRLCCSKALNKGIVLVPHNKAADISNHFKETLILSASSWIRILIAAVQSVQSLLPCKSVQLAREWKTRGLKTILQLTFSVLTS